MTRKGIKNVESKGVYSSNIQIMSICTIYNGIVPHQILHQYSIHKIAILQIQSKQEMNYIKMVHGVYMYI